MILNITEASESFIRLIYPEECVICKHILSLKRRHLCRRCHHKVISLRKTPLEALTSSREGFIEHIWTLFPYTPLIQQMVKEIKFRQDTGLLKHLIRLSEPLAATIFSSVLYDAVVYIPMSPFKKIERYFNPAEEIARDLSVRFDCPMNALILSKKWRVPSQMSLNQQERLANLFGAFKMVGSRRKKMRRILLIDDIYTTGATVQEAARIIKKHHDLCIDVLTLARTEHRNSHN